MSMLIKLIQALAEGEPNLLPAVEALGEDNGAIQVHFNNGAKPVYIDTQNHDDCRIGGHPAQLSTAISHLETNEESIEVIF